LVGYLRVRLTELQTRFSQAIRGAEIAEAEVDALRGVMAEGGVALENRLDVYRNNVLVGCAKAVVGAFPMVESLVGEEFMRAAVDHYVVEHPPTELNLNLYGSSFPEFIGSYPPAAGVDYLADVACLEWAWQEGFYAPDEAVLDISEIATLDPDALANLSLRTGSSIALIRSAHPLDEIVDACRSDQDIGELVLSQRGADMLILRQDYRLQMHRLTAPEYTFLAGMMRGASIAEVFDEIVDLGGELGPLMQKFFGLGCFVGYALMVGNPQQEDIS